MFSSGSLFRFAALSLCAHVGHSDQSAARMQGLRRGIIGLPGYAHRLRVCNAYTGKIPVQMLLQKGPSAPQKEINLTQSGPLPYKECRDFRSEQVNHGDSVEFKLNGEHLGSFAVSSLPRRKALLLLVLHRKNKPSSMPAFTSHMFAEVPHAQVAILDMYQGKSKSRILIQDQESAKDGNGRKEELAYDSVVAINSGQYKCVLQGKKGNERPLEASGSGNYVAIRVGQEGDSEFPEDMIIYPGKSHAAKMRAPLTIVFILGFVSWLF